MKFFNGLVLCLSLASISFAADVQTDFDPAINFKKFKTYSFIKGYELGKTGLLSDPQVRERIKNFISGVMDTRGLTEVPRDEKHDLAVRYWVARQIKSETHVEFADDLWMYGGYSPYWSGAWSYYYTEYVVTNFVQGTLVVDLLDPTTKELVWRTYLRQKIEDRAEAYKEAKKNLNKSFMKFPPDEKEKDKMTNERARLERKQAK